MHLCVNISLFLLLQITATLFFKWGSTASVRYWWGFGLGNAAGITSIIMLINVYKVLKPNLALAICVGGSFVLGQMALALVYHERFGPLSFLGVILIAAGIMLMSYVNIR